VKRPPEVIVCVDCGGRAHLVSQLDEEDPPQPGDVMVYRCADCLDRWDLVIEEADLAEEGPE
jgi:predicted RNA-binding Zn-ribbon protein involved in translation (DUF1610 family)